jgi:hypothetical protein
MPDLLAGSTVKALDTPTTVAADEPDSYTFTNTTYGVGTTGGTYVECGVVFVAPTTGRVVIHTSAQIVNSTTAATRVAPVVRTGGTIGSGTVVQAGIDGNAVVVQGTNSIRLGTSVLISGLTPGDTYNVRLEHRVTTGTGTASLRTVVVDPAT